MAWQKVLLAPVVWPLEQLAAYQVRKVHRKIAQIEQATKDHLQNISQDDLLVALSNALEKEIPQEAQSHADQVFDKFAIKDDKGLPGWNASCFERFVQVQYSDQDVSSSTISFLWHCFISAGFFPLPQSQHNQILDQESFKRAYILLVLQGIQLYGTKQKDTTNRRRDDAGDDEKVPIIARFIYHCVARSRTNASETERKKQDERILHNIQNSLHFTTPLNRDRDEMPNFPASDMYIPGPVVDARLFRDCAERLYSDRDSGLVDVESTDFRCLIQTVLVVRVREERWRDGVTRPLIYDYFTQRTSDIQYARLDLSGEEIKEASRLADACMPYLLGTSEGSIPFEAIERLCSDSPAFIFLFFQVWASIFAPVYRTVATQKPLGMPISVSNSLSLLQPVTFRGYNPRYRYFENELRLNLDLQNAQLVYEDEDVADSRQGSIEAVLRSGNHFHVMMFQGHRLSAGEHPTFPLLWAFFIAPDDPAMEMWRQSGRGFSQYIWRTSCILLTLDLQRQDGGPLFLDDDEQGRLFILKTLGQPNADGECGPEVVLDLGNRSCKIEQRDGQQDLTWTSLKCFRMPGVAARVTRSP